jgi:hypothetical protein
MSKIIFPLRTKKRGGSNPKARKCRQSEFFPSFETHSTRQGNSDKIRMKRFFRKFPLIFFFVLLTTKKNHSTPLTGHIFEHFFPFSQQLKQYNVDKKKAEFYIRKALENVSGSLYIFIATLFRIFFLHSVCHQN